MMKDYPFSDITYQAIGAAMEVHRELGSGFLEAVYHEALGIEMKQRNIVYTDEPQFEIQYKNTILEKKYHPDFIISDAVTVEIKALSRLTSTESLR
jgi:GxxExxY protein